MENKTQKSKPQKKYKDIQSNINMKETSLFNQMKDVDYSNKRSYKKKSTEKTKKKNVNVLTKKNRKISEEDFNIKYESTQPYSSPLTNPYNSPPTNPYGSPPTNPYSTTSISYVSPSPKEEDLVNVDNINIEDIENIDIGNLDNLESAFGENDQSNLNIQLNSQFL